ncbi:MAG: hypothetical protein HOP28_04070 [Gemmatimonadales bacterium]|nr:hypothetical protein [Gemmatimonadales bacterium]
MAGSSRSRWGAALAAAALVGSPLAAQTRVSGRVMRVSSGDTVAVPGLAVVLHRVGQASQGPVDTVISGGDGGFRFRFAPDSAAFLLSARYAGIEYFSSPIGTDPAHPDTAVRVIVADTSAAQPVVLRQRTLLVSRADQSGMRTVIDWLVLANLGERTRTAPDSAHPSWALLLPADAQGVDLADMRLSQFSPDALSFRRDSVLLFAPLSPGEKELLLQYRIPGEISKFRVPAGGVRDSVYVLLEEPSATVGQAGFVPLDSQTIEGRSFRRFGGTLGGAAVLDISLPGRPLSSNQTLVLLVAFAGTAFALLAAILVRRRRAIPAVAPVDPAVLADRVARLDAAYEGRAGDVPADEWSRYQTERAALRDELARALASRRPRS